MTTNPSMEQACRERLRCEPKVQPASKLTTHTALEQYVDGRFCRTEDIVAVEEPLHIRIDGHPEMFITRTPGDDRHLVIGHLFSQGMIRSAGDVVFRETGAYRAAVSLRLSLPRSSITPFPNHSGIRAEQIFCLRDRFEERQKLYHSTGATHAAGLFRADGTLVAYGEDVSRHCAFDKAVGRALSDGQLPLVDIAILTSRLAQELTIKAAMAGIPILCGFSAATSAGVQFAEDNDITLVGRIRADSFNVYANGWRIKR